MQLTSIEPVIAASAKQCIRVMQITDTLDAGGAERVAVNLANMMPREQFRTYLCTTRRDGALSELVAADVTRLRLQRTWRFDVPALRRLVSFIRQQKIQVLHAHGSALFMAYLASLHRPYPAVVWHIHFGRHAEEKRAVWHYRWFIRRVGAVLAVNEPLVQWSRERLGVTSEKIWYVPNFVCQSQNRAVPSDLRGSPGRRIVCVANLRPEKDHPTLLRAMALVVKAMPNAHLLLIGAINNHAYVEHMQQTIRVNDLEQNVSLLGSRQDVDAVLHACDVAVLSSLSEGLPLALLEYGTAGLPTVATRVGQCAEVLDQGNVGKLVSPSDPRQLAEALLALLQSPERRSDLGQRFRRRVEDVYSARAAIEQIGRVYQGLLGADTF
jgi:glycosyltransferase involved in cell wall biosynthesis